MGQWWWLIAGMVIGMVVMLPVVRFALRAVERRAREAERRALDAERLAELGAMTGGLAHEIKNPLSTVGLNAQLLAEGLEDASLPDDERGRLTRRLDVLRREVDRLRNILEDFLQFAGRMKLDPRELDLRIVVNELSDFYHPQCSQHGVMLRTQLPDEPVLALVDETLLKQAILNLMINATQAMTANEKSVSDAAGDEPMRELMVRLVPAEGATRLHVIDTGPGIEPDQLAEIFHPYVSNKRGGTGLGLPTARRIVAEHGGTLSAHSEPGRGSDFVIELPSNGANGGAS
ncbi:MAG: HAMP domain-containing sensor histidine kinase [Planctomycetota bacterium]